MTLPTTHPYAGLATTILQQVMDEKDKTEYERQTQSKKILVDHENKIGVSRLISKTEAEGKPPVTAYIIRKDGEEMMLGRSQVEAVIDMIETLSE